MSGQRRGLVYLTMQRDDAIARTPRRLMVLTCALMGQKQRYITA